MNPSFIINIIKSHQHEFSRIISINEKKEKVEALDLSISNKHFDENVFRDEQKFSNYIQHQLDLAKATFLIGGYGEERKMYRRSELFDKNLLSSENKTEEPRSLHLGTDIWGADGTKVHAPLGGVVHSFAFNNHDGDYGATIILQHQLDTKNFYTLYSHLSLKDIGHLREGQYISRGEVFAHFGVGTENGNWPSHLHFQIILDMGNYRGDYPGVCRKSEAQKWLLNSPDPEIILRFYSKGVLNV